MEDSTQRTESVPKAVPAEPREGAALLRTTATHSVLLAFGSVPLTHSEQVPFTPANPAAQSPQAFFAAFGVFPSTHCAQAPFVPANPAAQSSQSFFAAFGVFPSTHCAQAPFVPANPAA